MHCTVGHTQYNHQTDMVHLLGVNTASPHNLNHTAKFPAPLTPLERSRAKRFMKFQWLTFQWLIPNKCIS